MWRDAYPMTCFVILSGVKENLKMDLEDILNARLEREHDRLRQLDAVFSRLAVIVGRADFALSRAHNDLGALRDAFEALRNNLVHLLNQNEVELVGRPGEPIDPKRHTVEANRPAQQPGLPTVAEILEYGAFSSRHHRLLLPARVIAAVPEKHPQTNEG
jgi:molecular chaperone GrpE (heat shock protein)